MKAVIDTNVLLVANRQHDDVSPECVQECVKRLSCTPSSRASRMIATALIARPPPTPVFAEGAQFHRRCSAHFVGHLLAA